MTTHRTPIGWLLAFFALSLAACGGGAEIPPVPRPVILAGTVTYGETIRTQIAEMESRWTFEGEGGDMVEVILAPLTGIGFPPMAILNARGESIARSDNGTLSGVVLPRSGRYSIALSPTPGEYSLSLLLTRPASAPTITPPPTPTSPPIGRAIQVGERLNGNLLSGDPIGVWALDGFAGQVITITLEPFQSDLIPALRLFDPNGDLLISDDSADRVVTGGARLAQINGVVLPLMGVYTLQVSGGGYFGGYILAVRAGMSAPPTAPTTPTPRLTLPPTAPPTGTPTRIAQAQGGDVLSFGQTIRDSLSGAEEVDRYALFAPAGTILTVGVFAEEGSPLLPTLDLYAPDGTLLNRADGYLNPGEAVISGIEVPVTGAYVLFVGGVSGTPAGSYTIGAGEGWTLREVGGGIETVGSAYSGALLRSGDRVTWRVELPENATVGVNLTPQDSRLNAVLELVDPDGNQLVALRGGEGGVVIPAPVTTTKAGTYLLRVTSFRNESLGAFTLSTALIRLVPTATFAPIDHSAFVTLRQGEKHLYTFKGKPGDVITISVRAEPPADPATPPFDSVIELYAPDGRRIARADDVGADVNAALQTTLEGGIGEYRVEIYGYALMSGAFTLRVGVLPNVP